MDEQREQAIKQLESWSENQTEICLNVEIAFFVLALEGGLVAFEDTFIFNNQFCRLVFQPARCSDVASQWQEIGSQGYWLVRLKHPAGILLLYDPNKGPGRFPVSLD